MNITVIAKHYNMTGVKLNNLLKQHKVQYKRGNTWYLYKEYVDKGYAKQVGGLNKDTNFPYIILKWTPLGEQFINQLLATKSKQIKSSVEAK